MSLPPKKRTALGEQLSRAAEQQQLQLQQCGDCQHWSYPPREVCGHCLSGELSWQQHQGSGKILATVELANSFEAFYAERLPWRLVSVLLQTEDNSKPLVVYAHCHPEQFAAGAEVRLVNICDPSGANAFVAIDPELSLEDSNSLLRQAGFTE